MRWEPSQILFSNGQVIITPVHKSAQCLHISAIVGRQMTRYYCLLGCYNALIQTGYLPLSFLLTNMKVEQNTERSYLTEFNQGVQNFSLLFTRWMDTNEWSHPVMTSLAKSALNGTAWLHSSQISGLRHAKLYSPGPRTFIAIERLNYFVYRYITEKKLIPGTSSSNNYSKPYAITEDNTPPPLGWWVEVFCGARIPKDIDLKVDFFSETQAKELSLAWAALIRRLMIQNEVDIITELKHTIYLNYPANDHVRVQKIIEVIQNKSTWTSLELTAELPAIAALTAALGGPGNEQLLLASLQK